MYPDTLTPNQDESLGTDPSSSSEYRNSSARSATQVAAKGRKTSIRKGSPELSRLNKGTFNPGGYFEKREPSGINIMPTFVNSIAIKNWDQHTAVQNDP